MLKLTKEQQQIIEKQMFNKARDIDVAVYNCMVRNDFPKMLFSTALSGYQNKDGGFGHALEIDNYNKDSNAPQALEAFRLSDLVGFKKMEDDEILEGCFKKLFNYLYNRCEKWEGVIPSNNNAICASWYKYTDVNIKRFGYAPKPAIVGYTLKFTKENNPYYKKALVMAKEVINKFLEMKEFTNEEILSFKKFIELISKEGLFSDKQEMLYSHLYECANKMIERADFSKVCIMPLDIYDKYTEDAEINKLIDKNLDFLITSIKPHGLWDAPFDWSGEIGEGSTAQIKWIGAISCKYLDYLRKFNRIEE